MEWLSFFMYMYMFMYGFGRLNFCPMVIKKHYVKVDGCMQGRTLGGCGGGPEASVGLFLERRSVHVKFQWMI